MTINEKKEKLIKIIEDSGKMVIAFSGGVDSTLLLKIAHDVLGDNVIAVTIDSILYPKRETSEAISFCEENGIEQILVKTDVLNIDEFVNNPVNRCYLCKKDIFSNIKEIAASKGIEAVAEGSNVDDVGDYRPGMMAIEELSIMSPLKDAGLTKKEIREISKELSLPTWKKPTFACLATRFVYGEKITVEKLSRLDKAEDFLHNLGFPQVRVRIHGEEGRNARIEALPQDFSRIMDEDIRKKIYEELKSLGFDYVSLDLLGYRTGSMNEVLSEKGEKNVED